MTDYDGERRERDGSFQSQALGRIVRSKLIWRELSHCRSVCQSDLHRLQVANIISILSTFLLFALYQ